MAINYSILEICGNSPFIFCEHISAKLIFFFFLKSNSYERNSSFWQQVPLQPWIIPLMQKLWGGCSKTNELMHNYFFLKHYSLGSPVIAFSSSLRRECPHQKECLFRLVLPFWKLLRQMFRFLVGSSTISLGNPEFCPKKIGSCCCSLIIESALPAGTTVLIPLCWWEQTNPAFSKLRKWFGTALVEVLGKTERKWQASVWLIQTLCFPLPGITFPTCWSMDWSVSL